MAVGPVGASCGRHGTAIAALLTESDVGDNNHRARASNYWRDLWRYRELFRVVAWRDLAVRYKQTVIGVAWALIRPLLTMIVFNIIFGRIAKLPSDGSEPYPLMVFAGMLPWTFFSTALGEAANSRVNSAGLISKVFFRD